MADKTILNTLFKIQCQINALREGQKEKLGNQLIVSKEGSDGIARGDDHMPYLTLTGAIAAASSGDSIKVLPGTYTIGEIGSGADMENDGKGTINLKNGVDIHFENGVVFECIDATYGLSFPMQYQPVDGEVIDITITGFLDYIAGVSGNPLVILLDSVAFDATYRFVMEMNYGEILDFWGAALVIRASGDYHFVAKHFKLANTTAGTANNLIAINPSGTDDPLTINLAVEIDQIEFDDTIAGGDNRAILLIRKCIDSNVCIEVGNVFGNAMASGILLSFTGFGGNHVNNNIKFNVGNIRLLNPRVVDGTYAGFVNGSGTQATGNGSDESNKVGTLVFVYNQNATGDWKNNRIDITANNISGHTGASVYFNLRNENVTEDNLFSVVAVNIETEDDYPAVFIDTRNGSGLNLGQYSIRVHNVGKSSSVPIVTSQFGVDTHQIELIGRFASTDLTNPVIEIHESWTNPIVLRNAILLTTATNSIIRRTGATALNAVVYGSYANTAPAAFLTQLVDTITVDVNAV